MTDPVADVRIEWLDPAEGGRAEPPPGPLYPTTAQFADHAETFSVVLHLLEPVSSGARRAHSAQLTLLAPDRLPDLVEHLVPGVQLVIKEGRRTVAKCHVLSVRMVPATQP